MQRLRKVPAILGNFGYEFFRIHGWWILGIMTISLFVLVSSNQKVKLENKVLQQAVDSLQYVIDSVDTEREIDAYRQLNEAIEDACSKSPKGVFPKGNSPEIFERHEFGHDNCFGHTPRVPGECGVAPRQKPPAAKPNGHPPKGVRFTCFFCTNML